MNAHGQQTTALTDAFIDGYAIVGAPGYCADRLAKLVELGVTKFGVIGPNFVTRTATRAEVRSPIIHISELVLSSFERERPNLDSTRPLHCEPPFII